MEEDGVPHAGRVLLRTTAPALVLLAALLTGCSGDGDDCAGQAYRPDLAQQGDEHPVDALNTWLSGATGFDELPDDDTWVMDDPGAAEAPEVVFRSDVGAGWWVHLARTDDGGYVVDQATDEWTSCEDELS